MEPQLDRVLNLGLVHELQHNDPILDLWFSLLTCTYWVLIEKVVLREVPVRTKLSSRVLDAEYSFTTGPVLWRTDRVAVSRKLCVSYPDLETDSAYQDIVRAVLQLSVCRVCVTWGDIDLVCHHEGRFFCSVWKRLRVEQGCLFCRWGEWVALGRAKEATSGGLVRGPWAVMAEILSFSFFYRCGTWGRA